MIGLKKILNSLKDGMSTVSDWFEVQDTPDTPKKTGTEAAKEALKQPTGKPTQAQDQRSTTKTAKDTAPEESTESGQMVDCPNGGQKRIEYCREICTSREGCPAMEGKN